MTSIFSFLTSLGNKLQGEDLTNPELVDYYQDYFIETPILTEVFLIGLAIALAVAALFYFGVCNKVEALAKRYVWAILFLLVGGGTFAMTVSNIVGKYGDGTSNTATGIFKSAIDVTRARYLKGDPDEDRREEVETLTQEFCELFKTNDDSIFMQESLPIEIGVVNGIFAALAFLLFSIIITRVNFLNRLTIHGAGIPL